MAVSGGRDRPQVEAGPGTKVDMRQANQSGVTVDRRRHLFGAQSLCEAALQQEQLAAGRRRQALQHVTIGRKVIGSRRR